MNSIRFEFFGLPYTVIQAVPTPPYPSPYPDPDHFYPYSMYNAIRAQYILQFAVTIPHLTEKRTRKNRKKKKNGSIHDMLILIRGIDQLK